MAGAAEGKVVANLFAPAGDWDVPAGFAKNGDTLPEDAGIEHPAFQGVTQIMSSDFLVNTSDSLRPKFALQAKYAEALQDPRTIEKLELERRYWLQKDVPWMLVTDYIVFLRICRKSWFGLPWKTMLHFLR
ncbi:TnsA endonuclease N-terminal domain-containing protein [Candidatus Methylospira mobilis]|uniref:TnsA endonuclease N-terminal domain-containing protein n=1 Tax=Candidatus Methylospira mobilis TaxID=1808979 RepID=UPI0028E48ED0|nr:TnsA endonuclease N-terminal domain-containing protein [Candidatus Methylospira mobilis]WNV05832.1 TnsA endonuclease N-terminal domain-containing protein [Candidatus Methylospira mobilis]